MRNDFNGKVSSPTITRGKGWSMPSNGLSRELLSDFLSSPLKSGESLKTPASPDLPLAPTSTYSNLRFASSNASKIMQ